MTPLILLFCLLYPIESTYPTIPIVFPDPVTEQTTELPNNNLIGSEIVFNTKNISLPECNETYFKEENKMAAPGDDVAKMADDDGGNKMAAEVKPCKVKSSITGLCVLCIRANCPNGYTLDKQNMMCRSVYKG